MPEEIARHQRELVHLAVAAAQQKLQRFMRQLFDRVLPGLGADWVGRGFDLREAVAAEPQLAGRRQKARTAVAEAVDVLIDRERLHRLLFERFGEQHLRPTHPRVERWMQTQQPDHRGRLR